MKKIICAALLLASGVLAQENYSQWAAYKTISINTTTDTLNGAANVPGTVTNFPVLVRVTGANPDVFAQGSAGGIDVRFTDSLGTTRLKHQRERWDSTAQAAEFWVLLPTVTGGGITKFRMYWGKKNVADSSNGTAVFDTANGFRGVWHMNGKAGVELDATVNGDTMTAFTGAAVPPSVTGALGTARSFDGTSQFFIGSSPSTASGPMNITSTSPYTISAWVNASVLSTSTSSGNSILNKGDKQYNLQMYNLKWESATYASTWREAKSSANAVAGAWTHLVGVWPGGTTGTVSARIYVNGVYAATSLSAASSAPTTTYNDYIGVNPSSGNNPSTAPGDPATAPTNSDPRYWQGLIDEVTMSAVARDSNWVKLSYLTQEPSPTALVLGASVATSDTAKIAVNPANQIGVLGGTVTFRALESGLAPFTFKWVHIHGASTDTISGATADTLKLTNLAQTDTGSYKIIVKNSLGTAVSTAATLRLAVVPVITTQPLGSTLTVGAAAKLFVVATSIAPLSYQWLHIHGGTTDTIAGATTDTLKIASVALTDSGSYKVIVRNLAGLTLSNAAILAVNPVSIWSLRGGNGAFLGQSSGSALTFRIPEGAAGVRVTIADLFGRTVWKQTLRSGSQSGALTWNGNSAAGRVPAGIYLVRANLLDAKGNTQSTLQGKFAYRP